MLVPSPFGTAWFQATVVPISVLYCCSAIAELIPLTESESVVIVSFRFVICSSAENWASCDMYSMLSAGFSGS